MLTAPSASREILQIKICGERNTGSGYLEALISRNLETNCLRGGLPKPLRRIFPESERARDWYFKATRRHNLGWKHALAPSQEDLSIARLDPTRILFLTLTKNPYAWLLSLFRRPYHAKRNHKNFADFLAANWKTVGRENAPRFFMNPIEMWNQKNTSYVKLGDYATVVTCRYEDLLGDPEGFLETICRDHGLERRQRPFENVTRAIKGQDADKTFDDYRDYYLNERWRPEINRAEFCQINDSLDERLLSHFHYSRIEPISLEDNEKSTAKLD